MSIAKSKESILKKIRMALAQPTPLPFPDSREASFIEPPRQDLVLEFAEQFIALQGKFLFCMNETELKDQLHGLCQQNNWTKIFCQEEKWKNTIASTLLFNDIANCEAAITSCEALVARTGSVVISAAEQGRIASVYAPVHICIAYTSQLVYDITDALAIVQKKYGEHLPSLISFATGPSRTADIEKTLVVGVHGPKEVYCFVVEGDNKR